MVLQKKERALSVVYNLRVHTSSHELVVAALKLTGSPHKLNPLRAVSKDTSAALTP